MLAISDNAIYVENPVTSEGKEIYSVGSRLLATLPTMNALNGTLTTFETDLSTEIGDVVVVFSEEFPQGLETTAELVTDIAVGQTWLVTVAAVLTFPIESAYWMNAIPRVSIGADNDENRLLPIAETLTYVSAVVGQFVGTNDRAGMLAVGDTINLFITPPPPLASVRVNTPTVLTAVTELGVDPVTYTCTFDVGLQDLDIDVTIDPRITEIAGRAERSGVDIEVNYAPLNNPSPDPITPSWSTVQRTIDVPKARYNINEPFDMPYTESLV